MRPVSPLDSQAIITCVLVAGEVRERPRTRAVPVSRGLVALVDECDAELVLAHRWHALRARQISPAYCAQTTVCDGGKRRTVLMHRLIMAAVPGQLIDHADGDRLNNTRGNLRFCTAGQNSTNRAHTAPLRGVQKYQHKWKSQISIGGRGQHLGSFATPEDAARAYDAAAIAHYGVFARLNYPEVP